MTTTTGFPVWGVLASGGARPLRAHGHDPDHGFCTVCGVVWPCARARRDLARTGRLLGD